MRVVRTHVASRESCQRGAVAPPVPAEFDSADSHAALLWAALSEKCRATVARDVRFAVDSGG